ncbi:hypothetical protein WUBG_04640 [Wuchereria bancrofti]|uniref:Uncharacterized protein n=1 Tax=Wuchereria bancrofti TaxID=6293 RepID=J9F4P7_WUCBA|nr:hypothetical protein WUBG_04640 [Wuchereria bancrofti]
MHRRFGYKMASGLSRRKTVIWAGKLVPERPPQEMQSFTLTKEQQSGQTGIHRMPQLVHAGFNYREYPD